MVIRSRAYRIWSTATQVGMSGNRRLDKTGFQQQLRPLDVRWTAEKCEHATRKLREDLNFFSKPVAIIVYRIFRPGRICC